MKTRHKSPTLVSMWMLDVFCCALGCVIMLWVLESLSSTEHAKRAKHAIINLNSTRLELVAAQDQLKETDRKLSGIIAELQTQLAALTTDLTTVKKNLAVATTDVKTLQTALAGATDDLANAKKALNLKTDDLTAAKATLASTEAKVQSLTDSLQKKSKTATDLAAQVQTASAAEATLQKMLADRKADYDALTSQKKMADDRLTDIDAKYRQLEKESKETTAALAMSKKTEGELGVARTTIKDLQKKIDDTNASIIDLQGDKKKLADKVDQLRIESENKFAGIAMTGKRVVFIVDISGSMKLLDEKTPDPNKWPIVVETVSKVMRTIPDLEKYQLIIFSRSAKFVYGDGEWQDYKGEASLKRVVESLKATEPGGDTNLYSAFDLAFRLRPFDLDTIYLFSDGLPTSGPGLTPQQEQSLNANQQIDLLSKHLRSTLKSWNITRESRRVKINSIGFFYESPEVGAFLWSLSRENEGSFVGMSRP
jgi:predicted  nucleic acid-binding Zn-ribbon protein